MKSSFNSSGSFHSRPFRQCGVEPMIKRGYRKPVRVPAAVSSFYEILACTSHRAELQRKSPVSSKPNYVPGINCDTQQAEMSHSAGMSTLQGSFELSHPSHEFSNESSSPVSESGGARNDILLQQGQAGQSSVSPDVGSLPQPPSDPRPPKGGVGTAAWSEDREPVALTNATARRSSLLVTDIGPNDKRAKESARRLAVSFSDRAEMFNDTDFGATVSANVPSSDSSNCSCGDCEVPKANALDPLLNSQSSNSLPGSMSSFACSFNLKFSRQLSTIPVPAVAVANPQPEAVESQDSKHLDNGKDDASGDADAEVFDLSSFHFGCSEKAVETVEPDIRPVRPRNRTVHSAIGVAVSTILPTHMKSLQISGTPSPPFVSARKGGVPSALCRLRQAEFSKGGQIDRDKNVFSRIFEGSMHTGNENQRSGLLLASADLKAMVGALAT